MTCDICGTYHEDWTKFHWWDSPEGRTSICPRCFFLLGGWKGMFRSLGQEGQLEMDVQFLRSLKERGGL